MCEIPVNNLILLDYLLHMRSHFLLTKLKCCIIEFCNDKMNLCVYLGCWMRNDNTENLEFHSLLGDQFH